jgi:hypothetical protein
LSAGPGYRRPGLFGGHADFAGFAAASLKQYWMVDGRLSLPRLAGGRVSADLHAQAYDYPQEDFFGLGPDSLREHHSKYGLRNTVLEAQSRVFATSWLSLGGGVAHLTPQVGGGDGTHPVQSIFPPAALPGLESQPEFVRYEAVVDADLREPRGNARSGGRYLLKYQHYDDREGSRHDFRRVDADVQQFISLLRQRRVLALRAFASASEATSGGQIPFYLQPTLGGPDDLRGFRRFRFRDANVLLFQVEYRWEIFTAVDGAIFYDAGKVASRTKDLSLRDMESDYGIGFRFGTINGIFLRVEGAFGSSGGKHLVLRFGNVF